MNKNILPVFLSALAGLTASFLFVSAHILWTSSPGTMGTRELASEENVFRPMLKNVEGKVKASYESLPCPSEEEFKAWVVEWKLELPDGNSLDTHCDMEAKAKIARLMKLMKDLKFRFPERWPQQLRTDFSNSFHYVTTHTTKTALDLNQKNSIAYNIVAKKEIYLGGIFFTQDPLEAIGTIVHEARHSSPDDAKHTFCSAGDIPKTQGGCDQRFSAGKDAGAYSYNTLFELAIAFYAEDISREDREQNFVNALTVLGGRFNEIPSILARKVDVLAVLNDKNEVHLIHPFLYFSQKLDLNFGSTEEFPVRLEFFPSQNGLFILTNKDRLWSWSSLKGLKRYLEENISESDRVYDVARTRVPGADNPRPLMRFADQKMKYMDYDAAAAKPKLFDYRFLGRPFDGPHPHLWRFFMAAVNETIFLSDKGKVYFAPHYGNEPVFIANEKLDHSNPWVSGTGGVTYDEFYLLSQEGQLYFVDWKLSDGNGSTEDFNDFGKEYQLQKAQFAPENPLKKYAQGLKVEMGLGLDEQLYVGKYGNNTVKKISLPFPVKDFVLAQHSEFRPVIHGSRPSVVAFRKKCTSAREISDPWLGTGMGYSDSGELMMGTLDANEPCVGFSYSTIEELTPYFDTRSTRR